MVRPLWVLIVIAALISVASSQDKNVAPPKKDGKPDARLGLVASSLGIPAVPGYSDDNSGGDALPIPVIGGGGSQGDLANYGGGGGGGGHQGGSGPCQCVPIEQCPSSNGGLQGGHGPVNEGPHGGVDPGLDPGYGQGGDGSSGGVNPPKDGAGVIDIRIVNRPPGPGGVQCLAGQVFCCGNNHGGPTTPLYPGGGYTKCGSRQFLNVPGWSQEYGQAQFGAYPWMAVILGKGNNYIGAGALLNSYYVLTAAHKVQSWKQGSYMKVRFGEWNAKDDDEPFKNIEIEVERIDIHPEFNPDNLYNDIAVIKLAQPLDVNAYPHIKPVCLPQAYGNYVGNRCYVAGFGKDAFGNGKHSFIMKEVDLPIVESNTCENLLRGTRLGRYFELNRKSFICAGGEEGKDACTGDGGSPLVCENSGVWSVVGLVAWGIGCADYAVPGVYVNVPNYLQWIESKIYY